ncbi:hypothetical protein BC938DRAFT_472988 [Jimgerdemannia flammicorona]|uniref:Uncharacterized protein n=1 Tax=Jimgerdemannia flammicorona TaxID=994334 RepID=A0A433Q512_9FUNG|nr:hypothetical protein BC938DRAFT_472988 [Jimgerdemannia flammicorona]
MLARSFTRRTFSSTAAFLNPPLMEHHGPVYSAIHTKLTTALEPTTLEIVNESHLHAGHAAMQGVSSTETHFRTTCSAIVPSINCSRLSSTLGCMRSR